MGEPRADRSALDAVLALAALRNRLPRRSVASTIAAMAVLGLTVAGAVWTSVVVPLIPASVVTGAVFEHTMLAVTAGATVAFAAASWIGD